jgi:hypothetical protein
MVVFGCLFVTKYKRHRRVDEMTVIGWGNKTHSAETTENVVIWPAFIRWDMTRL